MIQAFSIVLRKHWFRGAIVALALAAPLPALAVQPSEVLSDPAQEARARELSKELRCMVCQNQSIDDSDAGLAKDLRVLVRERIQAGDNDQQVFDFLVARYGDFVRLRPPWELSTVLLWLSPLAILVGGGIGIVVAARRRRTAATATAALSADEEKRVADLLRSE
ncbi:cytochrome c-type biogenesis protein [Blastochloris viridis]|nr:cytochrome c-type biogenesis protein [Blastochloris viridis]ALK10101.1 Cytochrome c-type biogenesis protein CcmH precursor [Blastochloris viridis]CUU42765.1 Cytochrome c-type biogenesis protein CcmH precursor [Blastochloris viridis]